MSWPASATGSGTYEADVDGYAASGLPTRTMGRGIEEDRLFFAAALASGLGLAEAAGASR